MHSDGEYGTYEVKYKCQQTVAELGLRISEAEL